MQKCSLHSIKVRKYMKQTIHGREVQSVHKIRKTFGKQSIDRK